MAKLPELITTRIANWAIVKHEMSYEQCGTELKINSRCVGVYVKRRTRGKQPRNVWVRYESLETSTDENN